MIDRHIKKERLQQFSTRTIRCTVAISRVISDKEGQLVGTGIVLRLNGGYYLLTALHVVLKKFGYQGLAFFTVGHRSTCWFIRSSYECWGDVYDLALVKIDREAVTEIGLEPLIVDELAETVQDPNKDLFFIHGFPGKKSEFFLMANGFLGSTQPLLAELSSPTWGYFNAEKHLATGYSPTDWADIEGQKVDFVLPEGLSGSALWQMNYRTTDCDWTPETSRVAGLVTRWDPDGKCLISTRIEHVRRFLLFALRRERAYYHWLNRGKPEGDDWTDWFAAKREIPRLES